MIQSWLNDSRESIAARKKGCLGVASMTSFETPTGLLGTTLLITVLFLASVSLLLRIDDSAYLTEDDVPWSDPLLESVSIESLENGQVPKVLHQTWKEEVLPEKWRTVSERCRELMPD